MSPRLGRIGVGMAAAACAAMLASLVLPAPRPWLVWNASASAPLGAYRILGKAPIAVGNLVAITPPPALAALMARRQYLPLGVPMIKRVAALGGARVCRRGDTVLVDGKVIAHAAARDRLGRTLPVWAGCRRLRVDEVFVVNAPMASFDSRYFGPLRQSDVLGRAVPLLTRDTPSAALRWHRAGADRPASHRTKG